jgi:hypothetical protein
MNRKQFGPVLQEEPMNLGSRPPNPAQKHQITQFSLLPAPARGGPSFGNI